MQALIASYDQAIARRIQAMLKDRAWRCEHADGIDADQLAPVLRSGSFDVVVVVLPLVEPSKSNLEQLRKQIQGMMVVVGPADPKIILGALHKCGADEYVNIDDLEAEFEAVLRKSPHEAPGKLIAVLSPSGGGGSTTLAVNLATLLAEKASHCALLDLNLADGDAATMLNLKPSRSIVDFARHARRMDRTLFSQLLTSHDSGVELLAAPLEFEAIPSVTGDVVREAVAMARSLFPYVVADVDQSCDAEQLEALKLADVILLVFQLDFVSLHNVRRTLDYFVRSGVARSHVRLVANRYGQSAEISASQVEAALNAKIDFYLPEDPKDINRAENTGIPVVVGRPWTKISRSIGKLATELNGVTLARIKS